MSDTAYFDTSDFKNIGRPYFFNPSLYLQCVEMMIRSDELMLALHMLDNPPGWYRDNYPVEFKQAKETLYKNIYDQIQYGTDDGEAGCDRSFGENQWLGGSHENYTYPRAQIIEDAITQLNANGEKPWIYDLGCSHGNLPLGLLKNKKQFTYLGRGINYRIQEKLKGWLGDVWQDKPTPGQTTWLCCFEVLEHCFNPHDLIHSAYKVGVEFDRIFLSTPKYTLGHGLYNWKDRPLGHVRTYTPREFHEFAHKAFPDHKFALIDAVSMVLIGSR